MTKLMTLPPPPPPLAKLASLLLLTVLALPVANANPTSGMIDGNYAAAQMPAFYLHKHLRPGVARVCVQITSSGTDRLTGTVKTQDHGGTWTLRQQVSLKPASGAAGSTAMSKSDLAALLGIEVDNLHTPTGTSLPEVKNPGQEKCRHNWGTAPTNWCGERRTITPAHGWSGKLTSDNSTVRVQVRNHYMNMPGRYPLQYNQTCP